MKWSRLAVVFCLLVMIAVFCKTLLDAHSFLPEKVASHFNGAGQPNAWMPRASALSAFAWVLPFFASFVPVVAVIFAFLPWDKLNSVPWPPESRRTIAFYIIFQSLWWPVLSVAFWAFMLRLFVDANLRQPTSFDTALAFFGAGAFFLGVLVALVCSAKFFPRNWDASPPGTVAA